MSTLSMLAEKLWWPESTSKKVSFTCMIASFFSSPYCGGPHILGVFVTMATEIYYAIPICNIAQIQ